MMLEDRKVTEDEDAHRKRQARVRLARYDEHILSRTPARFLDRPPTWRLVYRYQHLYRRLDEMDHPLASAVRGLEQLEHALRGVKLWLLTDECHEEEAKARMSTVQECKDIISSTVIIQSNHSKESTISRLY